MTIKTSPHQTYALVSPQAFVARMDVHWTQGLNLVSSADLRELWAIMASTFVRSLSTAADDIQDAPWLVLQPPTGSGKTQGACLFAAMQAEANATEALRPVGVIIVTRLKDQADSIAAQVNAHARRDVAVVHHSDKRATPAQLQDCDVLVITHQAYVNASARFGTPQDAAWLNLATWRGGLRLLTIIDEALANAIESNEVTLDDITHTLAYIPQDLKLQYPEQIAALSTLQALLVHHAEPTLRLNSNALRLLWDSAPTSPAADMGSLRAAMRVQHYDTLVAHEENDGLRKRLTTIVDETLKDSQAVLESWAFYAQRGQRHSINSASFLIPRDIPAPVVLDATANRNFLWNLFGSLAQIVSTPPNARSYSAVTLHVARASGVGKVKMTENASLRFPRLFAALEAELKPESSVFMCTHKDTEDRAKAWDHPFAALSTGHWGAIDGRNDWEHCDTAVIFGLPYLTRVWSTGVFMAMQGPQDPTWLQAPTWGEHSDVRAVMEQRHLSVCVIQAINRIRCRRVIDDQGRSLPADIYIVLPKDKTGDAILQDILADMPELNVVPWAFDMNGPQVRKARTSATRESLVTFMTNRLPGETALSRVKRELALTAPQLKKLKEALRDPQHATTRALTELGVSYTVTGAGRGSKAFLMKAAA